MRLTKSLIISMLTLVIKSVCFFSTDALAMEPVVAGLKTGSVIGKHIFGLSRDFQGDPVMVGDNPLIYSEESIAFDLKQGEAKFRVSLFDNDIAGVYVSAYTQNEASLIDTSALPMGSVNGAHSISGAIKSPWNTVLFSEGDVVDGRANEAVVKVLKPYFKNKAELVEAYHYGWLNEVIILDNVGTAKAIKNFAAGRLFADSILAMPDGKTFYLHDANFSGNLYLFIAEEANSFAKGSLYVVGQDLSLEKLGESSALKMKFKLKRASFDAFYKTKDIEAASCAKSYQLVESAYGKECLLPIKKNRKYVGQFEPVRQSALLGVKPFHKSDGQEKVLLKYNGNNNEIILGQNNAVSRQFKLKPDEKLGTQYLISDEV